MTTVTAYAVLTDDGIITMVVASTTMDGWMDVKKSMHIHTYDLLKVPVAGGCISQLIVYCMLDEEC